ncbi:MAG: hypothetical protein RMK31_01915 [Candidatus Caldarchaeum sp.]|nr:hypothetical protein [Candidatus Caldarchaeum sp.]MDW8359324.1 hypothetical protein [Candidatus Caldarchaeum sp.]MDW8435060.1 hypothetical protein [Candidatus Caldarchaeum sp.]
MPSIIDLARDEASQLLQPGYLPFESGFKNLDNNILLVAALTRMHYCRKDMVEWWFAHGLSPREHTAIYKLWHNVDHVRGEWDEKWSSGNYIGASHIVDETLGGKPPVYKLKINFQEPSLLYDTSKFKDANATAMVAYIYDRDRGLRLGVMTHYVRDTYLGCEMRSRFWLENANTEIARNLFQHCVEEMSNLAVLLPYFFRIKK